MIKDGDVVGCLGKRGWGKSTVCKNLQSRFLKHGRVFVFDRLKEYDPRSSKAKISRTVTHHFYSFTEFKNAVPELERLPHFHAVFHLSIHDDETTLDQVCMVLYHMGDMLVVIEEIHHFASPQYLPSWIREIALTGRHQGIPLLYTTQRPGELHKTLLSQSSIVFCGKITEANDLAYLSKAWGKDMLKAQNLKQAIGADKKAYSGEFLLVHPGDSVEIIDVDYPNAPKKEVKPT